MVRRSTAQRVLDEAAFPIRVKLTVPVGGFGMQLNDMIFWMQEELPRGDFAHHGGGMIGGRDAAAFYFRRIEDAERFLEQFPRAELADGTISGGYSSPAVPFGRRE